MSTPTLEALDFDYVRTLVHERSGIVLEPGKEYLVEARLLPVIRREGFQSIQGLIAHMRSQPYNGLHQKVIEAMTTNETSFFRDIRPFAALQKGLLPEFLKKRAATKQLTIWSAASSTGQEPYSIAMILKEFFLGHPGWTTHIIASDISTEMVEQAREGRFSQLEVNRGLPAPMLVKYFEKHGLEWQIKADIRRMVEFQQLNLAASWPSLPQVDIVFMRNVLIYFDTEVKKSILARVRTILRPDGYLILGGAETTINLDETFEQTYIEKASCYHLRAR